MPWWSVKQLAEHYGLSERAIYAAIEREELIAHRFGANGRGVRVADADRIDWENRCRKARRNPPKTIPTELPVFSEGDLLARRHFNLDPKKP